MLLSLRGWGVEEFNLVKPAFLDAARWALYVERVAPYLEDLGQVIATPMPADPTARIAVARARTAAAAELPKWRTALGLEVGDGE